MNFPQDLESNGEMMTSSSQGDSLVNPTHQLESGSVKKMNAIYGLKCYESYLKLNPNSLWAKMFLGYLIGMGEWYSQRCVLTWNIRGTKSRPWLYLRRRSMPLTEEIEFGLLPTPNAAEGYKGAKTYNPNSQMGSSLSAMAGSRMLPTPIAGDWKGQRRSDGTASMLSGKASLGMLPTPTKSDFQPRWKTENWQGDSDLPSVINGILGTRSQLNPRFVAEMMGFPPNWTELPFQSGALNQSKATETQ
jgi:hypothetical protein